MRYHFLERLKGYLWFWKDPLARPCYKTRSIIDWYSDYRTIKQGTLEELLEGIRRAEALPPDQELTTADLTELLVHSTFIPTWCLCIYALSKIGAKGTVIEERLLVLLMEEEELVRRFAAIGLTKIGTVRALSAVVGKHGHGHAIRTTAAHQLAELGPTAEAAIPALLALIAYKKINWRSHYAAATALAKIGSAAVPHLLKEIEQEDKHRRYCAAVALSSLEPTPITNPLIEAILKDIP